MDDRGGAGRGGGLAEGCGDEGVGKGGMGVRVRGSSKTEKIGLHLLPVAPTDLLCIVPILLHASCAVCWQGVT